MKKTISLLSLFLLSIMIFGCTDSRPMQKNNQQHSESHVTDFPFEEISQSEIEALNLAINDEYKAHETYRKVIDKFGEVKPFSNIILSEEDHIDELKGLYAKYDLVIPENDWYEKVPEFDSVQEACDTGVEAEIDNAALYDQLFSKVDNEDIITVFTSLRDASENNHLPAFEKCGGAR